MITIDEIIKELQNAINWSSWESPPQISKICAEAIIRILKSGGL